jgi:spermidine synthase
MAGLVACAAGLVYSERLVSLADAAFFEDDVVLAEDSQYQRIVVTRWNDRYRLFLNGSIQFDTLDEHRYHEALVHPAMALAHRRADVLILGGGDGMAAREVLRWPGVQSVTLVDLDPRVTELFATNGMLSALNEGSLRDPRVMVVNEDAWLWVRGSEEVFDVILLDLPDPRDFALSKLYSAEFYAALVQRLSPRGAMVTQAGSPVFSREAFWSVARTLGETRNPLVPEGRLETVPYHAYVPSFGDWGFVLASHRELPGPEAFPTGLKFLTLDLWDVMQRFPADSGPVEVRRNTLQSHPLVRYYENGWARWMN